MFTGCHNARQNKKTIEIIRKKENKNEVQLEIFELEKRSKMKQIALFNQNV